MKGTGNKGDIGPAEGNDPANSNGKEAIFFKGPAGGMQGIFRAWKMCGKKGQKPCTAFQTQKIADAGANKPCQYAHREQKEKGNPLGGCKGSGKGKDNFAGYRKTGIFCQNQDKHGKNSIFTKKADKRRHKVSSWKVCLNI